MWPNDLASKVGVDLVQSTIHFAQMNAGDVQKNELNYSHKLFWTVRSLAHSCVRLRIIYCVLKHNKPAFNYARTNSKTVDLQLLQESLNPNNNYICLYNFISMTVQKHQKNPSTDVSCLVPYQGCSSLEPILECTGWKGGSSLDSV